MYNNKLYKETIMSENNPKINWDISSLENKLGIKSANEINNLTGYERTIHSIRRYSVLACVFWWFCWLLIPVLFAIFFQIILIIKTLELKDDQSKMFYLILSLLGIFWIGWILDIIIAIKSSADIARI